MLLLPGPSILRPEKLREPGRVRGKEKLSYPSGIFTRNTSTNPVQSNAADKFGQLKEMDKRRPGGHVEVYIGRCDRGDER